MTLEIAIATCYSDAKTLLERAADEQPSNKRSSAITLSEYILKDLQLLARYYGVALE